MVKYLSVLLYPISNSWNGLLRCSSPTQPKSNFLLYGLSTTTTQFRVQFSQLNIYFLFVFFVLYHKMPFFLHFSLHSKKGGEKCLLSLYIFAHTFSLHTDLEM